MLLARRWWRAAGWAFKFCVDPDAFARVITCKSQLVIPILQTLCNIAKMALNTYAGAAAPWGFINKPEGFLLTPAVNSGCGVHHNKVTVADCYIKNKNQHIVVWGFLITRKTTQTGLTPVNPVACSVLIIQSCHYSVN